jgi:hypothetical protein
MNNRFGAPRKPEDQKRNFGIHIQITKTEKSMLIQEANRQGMTISELVRRVLFKQTQRKEQENYDDKST